MGRSLLLALGLAVALAGCGPDAEAELTLGKQLLAGSVQAPGDPAGALPHLQRAAEAHLPAAAYHLGLLYQRGAPGVPVDRAAALHWMRLAAHAGLADAQFMLGQMLAAGRATVTDPVQARHWFEQAAAQDHPEANLELAMAYRRGNLGVAIDSEAADRYLMEAQHGQAHRPSRP